MEPVACSTSDQVRRHGRTWNTGRPVVDPTPDPKPIIGIGPGSAPPAELSSLRHIGLADIGLTLARRGLVRMG